MKLKINKMASDMLEKSENGVQKLSRVNIIDFVKEFAAENNLDTIRIGKTVIEPKNKRKKR